MNKLTTTTGDHIKFLCGEHWVSGIIDEITQYSFMWGRADSDGKRWPVNFRGEWKHLTN